VFGSSFNRGHVVVDPSAIDFGSVPHGTSATRTMTVRNGGETWIDMGAATFSPKLLTGGPFSIVSDGCAGRALSPLAACSVEVEFQPVSVRPFRRSFSSTLRINSTEPPSSASVALTGVGTVPAAPGPAKPTIAQMLDRLTLDLPALLRGGPRRLLRLPACTAPTDGTLSLSLRARPTLLARTSRFVGWNDPRRLGFRLTNKGRKLLRRPRATRVKVTVAFRTAAGQMTVWRATVTVKRPGVDRGRERADVVLIRAGDSDYYSAGAENPDPDNLPEWPPADLRLERRRARGFEAMDKSRGRSAGALGPL
jgi:hypothetical protein